MKQWMNWLITLIGVLLITLAIYLFSKPYIYNYLHEKDNDHKIENYDKKEKEQTKTINIRDYIILFWQSLLSQFVLLL